MFYKKYKQLVAAALVITLIIGQAPTAYAEGYDELSEDLLEEEAFEEGYEDEDEELLEEWAEDELLEEELIEEPEDDAAASYSDSEEELTEDPEDEEEAGSESGSDASSEEVTDPVDEADVSGNAAPEEELPQGLVGMPEGYVLTADEAEMKNGLMDNADSFAEFEGLTEGVDYVENQVVCMADSEEHAQEIARAYSGTLVEFAYGVALIDLTDSELSVAQAYSVGFQQGVNIPIVEPNYICKVDEDFVKEVFPADAENEQSDAEEVSGDLAGTKKVGAWQSVYGKIFSDPALNPTSPDYQYYHDMIGSYTAWKKTTGGSYTPTVAIISSGVQTNHPDLKGANIYTPSDWTEVKFRGDNTGNGTEIAGVIAAVPNKSGGVGIAPKSKIISLGCLDSDVLYYTGAHISEALNYCAGYSVDGYIAAGDKRRADIAMVDFASGIYSTANKIAVNNCYKRGVTVIASTGESYGNTRAYPAAFKHVIAVSAVDKAGKKTDISTTGSWCDISAPGIDVFTTYKGSSYAKAAGSHMSAAIVTGSCALYMSYAGYTSPDKMLSILKKNATGNPGKGMGAGIVNVGKMIASAQDISKVKPKTASIKTMQFSQDKIPAMTFDAVTGQGSTATVSVSKILDTKKKDITDSCKYKWVSSNAKILAIDGVSDGQIVNLKAVGAGKATLTCKVLYGSMKKPKTKKFVVTVGSKKIVGKVSVTTSAKDSKLKLKYNKDQSLKAGVLYKGSDKAPSKLELTSSQYNTGKIQMELAAAPSWTSSNTRVAIVTPGKGGNTATVTAVGKGKATITCAARDGSGKKAKVTIQVKQLVTGIKIKGQTSVAAGSKATFKAVVTPSNANSKKVTWSLKGTPGKDYPEGVKIDKKTGVVKIPKGVNYDGVVKVMAVARDYGGVTAEKAAEFIIKGSKAKKVVLTEKGLTKLSTVDTDVLSKTTRFTAEGDNGAAVTWRASNKNVSIRQDGNTVTVTAVKDGRTTLIAAVNDGSGKRLKKTINVINPASDIEIVAKGRFNYKAKRLAKGGSASFRAVLGKTYGTLSTNKVKWEYTIYGIRDGKRYYLEQKYVDELKKNKAFFTFSSRTGTVKCQNTKDFDANVQKYRYIGNGYTNYGIELSAATTDGSKLVDKIYLDASSRNTEFTFGTKEDGKFVETKSITTDQYGNTFVYFKCQYHYDNSTYEVTSSNPSVVSAYMLSGQIIDCCCYKKGTATITVKATDGSGVVGKIKIKVTK